MARTQATTDTERLPLLRSLRHIARPAHAPGPQDAIHPDTLELAVVLSGREHSSVDGVRGTLRVGSTGLIPPGIVHSSRTGERPISFFALHLDAQGLEGLAASLGLETLRWRPVDHRTDAELLRLVRAAAREQVLGRGAPGQSLLLETFAVQMGVHLLRRHQAMPAARDAQGRLRRAEERMRADPAGSHSLAALAEAAGLSPFHFLRAFKKAFGQTPHAYLTELRLARAEALIREGAQSLTEVALGTGFGSSSRLAAVFRARHGVPPSRWRQGLNGGSRR